MALTLVKSSSHPNPEADIEVHEMTYSLMPHVGGWRDAQTPEMAYRLNVPVLTAAGGGGDRNEAPFAVIAEPNVMVEVVKQALDGNGIIVRVYECYGRRSTGVKLKLGFVPEEAEICNLMERRIEGADLDGSTIAFDIRPYEIKTFRIR